MLLKLFQIGEPVLRANAKKVTKSNLLKPDTQQLIDLMIGTLRDYPGVGLAAPQVGEDLQIVVIEDKKEYHQKLPKMLLKEQGRVPIPLQVLVNPKLKILDPETIYYFEGCLSISGYRAVVPRSQKVEVKAWDRHGKPITIQASGYYARILQHEIDHLNGLLYVDNTIAKSFMTEANFSKYWRKANSTKIRKILDQK